MLNANIVNIVLAGASGRMGKEIIERISIDARFKLVGAIEDEKNIKKGVDAMAFLGKQSGVELVHSCSNLSLANKKNIVFIDFSCPENSSELLRFCGKYSIGIVIGTTGFTIKQKEEIKNKSNSIPVLVAPNMSVGVNKMFALIKKAAEIYGEDYDVEVFEAHHKHKKDAPSGTALRLGTILAQSREWDSTKSFCFSRHKKNSERQANEIGFSVLRAGDIVGKHSVTFADSGETLEIIHNCTSRAGYAKGALEAATFVARQNSPGLFSMDDVIKI